MSDFNIFGQQFNNVNGFRLADTSGTSHNFFSTEAVVSSNLLPENIADGVVVKVGTVDDDDCIALITGTHQGGVGAVWQDENGQVHFANSGTNTVESLTVTENGTYTNPSGSYNPVVVRVQGGGGDDKQIKFIDYDGEIVEEYTLEEFQALDGMPANPSHTGLTAQGWNWTRQEVLDYLDVMSDWPVVVGQLYVTESGKTEIDIELKDGFLSPWLLLYKETNTGELEIDWGDNTTHDIITSGYTLSINHTYAAKGKYTIKIEVRNTTYYFNMPGTAGTNIIGLLRSGEQAYYNQAYVSTIKAIRIGNGMNEIRNLNFCTNLEYITVPSAVNGLNSYNRNLYSLKSLTLPKITSGSLSFFTYLNLKNISISPSSSIFPIYEQCSLLEYVSFPSGETAINASTFSGCKNLKFGTFKNTTKFNNQVFYNCYSLSSITLPSSLESIGTYTFSGTSLSSIDIPSTVSSIGQYSFSNCSRLSSVTLPSALSTLWPGMFAYSSCLSSIVLPSALTSIGQYAFQNTSLSLIDIPTTVSSIGYGAFRDSFLSLITLPSALSTIWPYTFYDCYSLSSITLPNAVSSIGAYAFQYDYSLSSITVPASTTYIGNYTFSYCNKMQEYHFLPTTPPTIGTYVFQNIPATCKIYVPYSSDHSILNAYKTKTNWATWSSYMVEEDSER